MGEFFFSSLLELSDSKLDDISLAFSSLFLALDPLLIMCSSDDCLDLEVRLLSFSLYSLFWFDLLFSLTRTKLPEKYCSLLSFRALSRCSIISAAIE